MFKKTFSFEIKLRVRHDFGKTICYTEIINSEKIIIKLRDSLRFDEN